jgi:uncharacterized protein (DUF1015 family)
MFSKSSSVGDFSIGSSSRKLIVSATPTFSGENMAHVFPFRAYRYNPQIAPYERVLTQPYDKISPAAQDKYYAADAHNLISVEKGRVYPGDSKENNVYTRAAAALQGWINEKAVEQDPTPSFYAYSQEYVVPGTDLKRIRRGFIGAGKLEEYSAGVIFRHEQTLSGPKADRLDLLRHTRTHTGQLFMLYSDPHLQVDRILKDTESGGAPVTQLTDEYGVIHRLWKIAAPGKIEAIQRHMAEQKLVIADGHHRYETSLNFRNESRTKAGKIVPNAAYERSMMTFINTQSEGLTILPTHRVVLNVREFSWTAVLRYLEPWFSSEMIPFHNESERSDAQGKFLSKLTGEKSGRTIGAYPKAEGSSGAFYLLHLRPGADLEQLLPELSANQRELDVVLLHQGILEPALGITPQAVVSEANLSYEREAAASIDAVDKGKAQVAFLLNPVSIDLMMRVATAGEVMPQKSTDFYPKLLSGITMYRVED